MVKTIRVTILLGLCLTSLAHGFTTSDEITELSDKDKINPLSKSFPSGAAGDAEASESVKGIPEGAMSNQLPYNTPAAAPGSVIKDDLPFIIRIAKNNGEPGQSTVGRFLSIDDAYLRDYRNSETHRCNFHEGVHYAAIWEKEPGQSPDTFYLRVKSNPRGIAKHRYLAVLEYPPYQSDRRDQDSLWLVVHQSKEEAIEWRAVGTDSRSVYLHAVRNHSKTGGWTTGFSVSARELLPVDKRDAVSTYAMVHSYMAAGLEIIQ